MKISMYSKKMANNSFQRTTISVIFFAGAKKPPLMVAAEAGVIFLEGYDEIT